MGNQSLASENAIIINNRIHKLGHLDISYDQNSLTNPWLITSDEGVRVVFAPFVEYETESMRLYWLSSKTKNTFGKFMGKITVDGEEIEMNEVLGFAEIHVASW